MNTITVNGVTLECDFNDADFMDAYESALNNLTTEANELTKFRGSTAEGIRKLCAVVNAAFDEIFGEGTSEELFNGRNNQLEHLKAMDTLVEESNRAKKELSDFTNKYVQKQRSQQVRTIKDKKSQQTTNMKNITRG